jgi:very-short-patch-repair endonuclease
LIRKGPRELAHSEKDARPEERARWKRISSLRPRSTRQLAISDLGVADLACCEARLAIELDQSQHIDRAMTKKRTVHLTNLGWHIIRFWNSDVGTRPDGVAQAILNKIAECLGGVAPEAVPSRAGRFRNPRRR